jgi:hypothetical protein
MKILLRDSNNNVFYENLDSQCYTCEEQCIGEDNVFKCPINSGDEFMLGKRVNINGTYFLCCNSLEANTSNLFKDKLDTLLYTSQTLKKVKEDIFS